MPEKRDAQFALMRDGQKAALNLANWHHFLSALTLACWIPRQQDDQL